MVNNVEGRADNAVGQVEIPRLLGSRPGYTVLRARWARPDKVEVAGRLDFVVPRQDIGRYRRPGQNIQRNNLPSSGFERSADRPRATKQLQQPRHISYLGVLVGMSGSTSTVPRTDPQAARNSSSVRRGGVLGCVRLLSHQYADRVGNPRHSVTVSIFSIVFSIVSIYKSSTKEIPPFFAVTSLNLVGKA